VAINSTLLFWILVALLIAERLVELRSAKRNVRQLILRGGIEFGSRHYPLIVAMHATFFTSLVAEFIFRGDPIGKLWYFPFILFLLAQSLRLWARMAMGDRWTTRVFVVPGEKLIARGPFRFVSHPIYIAVVLEIFSFPIIFGLYFTCVVFSVLNAIVLLTIRVPAERDALSLASHKTNS